jgi:hypothetical protein
MPFDLARKRAYWLPARAFSRAIVPLEHVQHGDE